MGGRVRSPSSPAPPYHTRHHRRFTMGWLSDDPIQAATFVVIVVGIPILFLLLCCVKRIRHRPQPWHVRVLPPRVRSFGPTPRMWDVHAPDPGCTTDGSWEDVQVSAQDVSHDLRTHIRRS
jgi:hypothetical protein